MVEYDRPGPLRADGSGPCPVRSHSAAWLANFDGLPDCLPILVPNRSSPPAPGWEPTCPANRGVHHSTRRFAARRTANSNLPTFLDGTTQTQHSGAFPADAALAPPLSSPGLDVSGRGLALGTGGSPGLGDVRRERVWDRGGPFRDLRFLVVRADPGLARRERPLRGADPPPLAAASDRLPDHPRRNPCPSRRVHLQCPVGHRRPDAGLRGEHDPPGLRGHASFPADGLPDRSPDGAVSVIDIRSPPARSTGRCTSDCPGFLGSGAPRSGGSATRTTSGWKCSTTIASFRRSGRRPCGSRLPSGIRRRQP